jgi:hypothetical protein
MAYRREEEKKIEAIGAVPTTLDRIQQMQALMDHRDEIEKVATLSDVAPIQKVYQETKPLIEQNALLPQVDNIEIEKHNVEVVRDDLSQAKKERAEISTIAKEIGLPEIEKDVTVSLIDKAIELEKRSLDIAEGYLKEAEKEREKLTKYSKLQHLLEAEQEKFGKKKEIILSPEICKAWNELHQTDTEIPEIQEKKSVNRETFISVLSHVSTTCEIVPSKVQSLMARVHHTWNKSLTIIECARRGMHHIMDTIRHITRQSSPK